MLSSSNAVAVKPANLPPTSAPAFTGAGSAGGPTFAQFLNSQPPAVPPPAHADGPSSPQTAPPPTAAASPAAGTAPTAPQARRKDGSAPATPPPAATRPTSRSDAIVAAGKAAQGTDDRTAPTDDDPDGDTPAPPDDLTDFTQLISLPLPAQPAVVPAPVQATAALPDPAGASRVGQTRAAPTDETLATATTPGGDIARMFATTAPASGLAPAPSLLEGTRAASSSEALATTAAPGDDTARPLTTSAPAWMADSRVPHSVGRTAEEPQARAAEPAAEAFAATAAKGTSSDTIQALQPSTGDTALRTPATPDAQAPNFSALLAQAALPNAATAADPAAPSATGQVHAALNSAAFAPELGTRVSLMAVDGVQQAELQLNPTDMGPVSVQIVVDGAQAQVSFHAAQADTRQALEKSLPDLAAALQGQGLTLSGGGVFQQSQRDPQASSSEGSRTGVRGGRGGAAGTAAVSEATLANGPALRRTAGLLDTFA